MSPFNPFAKHEIYKRDEGTCQGGDNCICQRLYGKQATVADGFRMNAAHYPDDHQRELDSDTAHGRLLDVNAHIIEEIRRGNAGGARLLHQGQRVRSDDWIRQNGGRDEKMGLDWYFAYELCDRDGDQRGLQGLVEIFRDTFGY